MLTPVAIVGVLALAGCGGNNGSSGLQPDRHNQIADQIGATTCTSTNYDLIIRATNTKLLIYDCVRNGKTVCVTEQDGIAHDSTADVRLVFADSLSGKPSCLGG